MISVEDFWTELSRIGFTTVSGVPCSYLKPLINYALKADSPRFVQAVNEGDAVATCAGAWLAGGGGVAVFQNSGLGNAVNPLSSLCKTFRIPVLLIVTLRGDPEGKKDEPQHELMGKITRKQLDLLEIEQADFPANNDEMKTVFQKIHDTFKGGGVFALVMKKGSLGEVPAPELSVRNPKELNRAICDRRKLPTASQVLETVLSHGKESALIATTGYRGRELLALGGEGNCFPMVGSMGCALPLGLGVALNTRRRVIVLDGDGALLMRMGALAAVGHEAPDNLVHIVIDNRAYESTGGQPTVSENVDFASAALACGYERGVCADLARLEAELSSGLKGPVLLHVPVMTGTMNPLPRPSKTMPDIAASFQSFLKS